MCQTYLVVQRLCKLSKKTVVTDKDMTKSMFDPMKTHLPVFPPLFLLELLAQARVTFSSLALALQLHSCFWCWAELGGIFGWIGQCIWYNEHIQSQVSMLVLSAFSWAACPGMWEGKVRSALAHMCNAMEWLLRCPLQLPAPAFAFPFLNFHPEILRLLCDPLPPNLLHGSARLLSLGQCSHLRDLVQKEELCFSFMFSVCSFMTVNGALLFNGETVKGSNKKQWERTQKGNLKNYEYWFMFFPDISAESQKAVQREYAGILPSLFCFGDA